MSVSAEQRLLGKPTNISLQNGSLFKLRSRYVGKLISRHVAGKNDFKPFRYFDKGNMAVVGKGYAVLQSGRVQMHGLLAWFAWTAIHNLYLAQSSLRISVFLQWLWTFFTGQRGSRLIVEPNTPEEPKADNANCTKGDLDVRSVRVH